MIKYVFFHQSSYHSLLPPWSSNTDSVQQNDHACPSTYIWNGIYTTNKTVGPMQIGLKFDEARVGWTQI